MNAAVDWALAALAVWRVTHLLAAEDGPGGIVVRLRRRAGHGWLGEALDCFHCLSLWVAAPAAACLAVGWRQGLLGWLGLSAAAILLERAAPAWGGGPAAFGPPFDPASLSALAPPAEPDPNPRGDLE
ncbi:hypothetical protein [Caldimonas brevitalea]|uniref:DUF1360 domain-containing protein n=1 Tax=Caldimonas brevitalea TaxID=413882 RepID=A0A0G3BJJ3_9BURK|nr:hypothetical protein [Caldimonas brevitalea]AKJ27546.1 hypothetical protein AAW51_0855 [Caldimonas brevitalea]